MHSGVSLRQVGDRWSWSVDASQFPDLPCAVSTMSFSTRSAALRDFELHLEARLDENGRVVTSRAHVESMMREAVDACSACDDSFIRGLMLHARDADGCNWTIDVRRGVGWRLCAVCLQPQIDRLRLAYCIAEGAEADGAMRRCA